MKFSTQIIILENTAPFGNDVKNKKTVQNTKGEFNLTDCDSLIGPWEMRK